MLQIKVKKKGTGLVTAFVVAALALLGVKDARAATLTVTNLNDNASSTPLIAGSLRERITTAAAGDTIVFQTGLTGTVTLKSGQFTIAKNLTIVGPGATKLTISGNNTTRIFSLGTAAIKVSGLKLFNAKSGNGGAFYVGGSGTITLINCVIDANAVTGDGAGLYTTGNNIVNITGCTFSNNNAASDGGAIDMISGSQVTLTNCTLPNNTAGANGGAIENASGTLAATNCVFSNNAGGTGGSVYSIKNVTLSRCTFANNRAKKGGAIYNTQTASVTDSSFSGNKATQGDGGAIHNNGLGVMTMERCVVSGGDATGNGGGVFNDEILKMRNCTISGNTAGTAAGIYMNLATGDSAEINNSTVTKNTSRGAAGGVRSNNALLKITSSIIASNTATTTGPDVSGTFGTGGFNLIGIVDGSSGFTNNVNSDQVGTGTAPINPGLGALASNGGPTLTHALLTGSKAIDKGSAGGLTTDQRGTGFVRKIDQSGIANAINGDGTDIGAYEAPLPLTITINNVAVNEGNSGTTNANFTVTLSAIPTTTVTVKYATANGTATAGSDYTAKALTTLTFAAGGARTQTISVPVIGDTINEPNETFFVNLSSATSGAVIADAQGQGTINNDDPVTGALPRLAITDVSSREGNSGATTLLFTVNVFEPNGQPITVHYATANGTATAGSDYTARTDTVLTIAGTATYGIIAVQVTGDKISEVNETFRVNLSSPTNATLADGVGLGTIINDDTAAASVATLQAEPKAQEPVAPQPMEQPQVEANTSSSVVSVQFPPTVDANAFVYVVRINGNQIVATDAKAGGAGVVFLFLPEGSLQAGDEVTVLWAANAQATEAAGSAAAQVH